MLCGDAAIKIAWCAMFFVLSLLFVLLFAGGALGRALLMLLMVEIGVVTGLLSVAAIVALLWTPVLSVEVR